MTTYQDLKNQAAELLRQAEDLRSEERAGVIQQVREAVSEWGISASELGLKAGRTIRAKLPVKYRDPLSGREWCGRGAMPKWMSEQIQAGASKDQFRI